MADFFDKLEDKHTKFINKQLLFTVATAPKNGRINVSPKGMDSFRVIDEFSVAYLDVVGSGNETAAHLLEDDRITIMFMSFSRNPQILRIYGKGMSLQKNSKGFKKLIGLFPETIGVRQVFTVKVETVSTSCGYTVPIMDDAKERDTLTRWHTSKGDDGLIEYQKENNLTTIDGLKTGLVIED